MKPPTIALGKDERILRKKHNRSSDDPFFFKEFHFPENSLQLLLSVAQDVLNNLWKRTPAKLKQFIPRKIYLYEEHNTEVRDWLQKTFDPLSTLTYPRGHVWLNYKDISQLKFTTQKKKNKEYVTKVKTFPICSPDYFTLCIKPEMLFKQENDVRETIEHELLHIMTMPAISNYVALDEAIVQNLESEDAKKRTRIIWEDFRYLSSSGIRLDDGAHDDRTKNYKRILSSIPGHDLRNVPKKMIWQIVTELTIENVEKKRATSFKEFCTKLKHTVGRKRYEELMKGATFRKTEEGKQFFVLISKSFFYVSTIEFKKNPRYLEYNRKKGTWKAKQFIAKDKTSRLNIVLHTKKADYEMKYSLPPDTSCSLEILAEAAEEKSKGTIRKEEVKKASCKLGNLHFTLP